MERETYSKVQIGGYVYHLHEDTLDGEDIKSIGVKVREKYNGKEFTNFFLILAPIDTEVKIGQYVTADGILKRRMTEAGFVFDIIPESMTFYDAESEENS